MPAALIAFSRSVRSSQLSVGGYGPFSSPHRFAWGSSTDRPLSRSHIAPVLELGNVLPFADTKVVKPLAKCAPKLLDCFVAAVMRAHGNPLRPMFGELVDLRLHLRPVLESRDAAMLDDHPRPTVLAPGCANPIAAQRNVAFNPDGWRTQRAHAV